jgi:hypothetical protein
MLFIKENL